MTSIHCKWLRHKSFDDVYVFILLGEGVIFVLKFVVLTLQLNLFRLLQLFQNYQSSVTSSWFPLLLDEKFIADSKQSYIVVIGFVCLNSSSSYRE